MSSFYAYNPITENGSSWNYGQYSSQLFKPRDTYIGPQDSFPLTYSTIYEYTTDDIQEYSTTNKNTCPFNNKDPKKMSNSELIKSLNSCADKLLQLHNQDPEKQYPNLVRFINGLCELPRLKLISIAQNKFFSSLEIPMRHLIRRWRLFSSLSKAENSMFDGGVRLLQILVKDANDIGLIPPWFSESTFLKLIADCLQDIGTAGKFLDSENNDSLKTFSRLLSAYVNYQHILNDADVFNKDTLVILLDPIISCLTSSYYADSFINASQVTKPMTNIEKFFLLKCPTFLTSYNGYRLEQAMKNLLSTKLSQHTNLLGRIISSANRWKTSMIRAVIYLIQIINHGSDQFPINTKSINENPSLIDHIMKLLNQPRFYNRLNDTLSNPESILINTIINFLVGIIKEPAILARIKQLGMASTFLHFTSCQYEPLAINLYTLLASTANEEDIKKMKNPGRLLEIIIKSLQTTISQTPEDKSNAEQLLETLKGLVQHDQIKDEILHQNALPFLLEYEDQVEDKGHVLILEILWSISFRDEGAQELRTNTQFLDKIQGISQNAKEELLKKVADGLVWKLIKEPEFLEKIAQREADNESDADDVSIDENILNADGTVEHVTRRMSSGAAAGERTFPYDMMISYCHADKELTYKIHKFLVDQGFKVWIDLDNMHGPAMNAMAEAVESSEFVIMCMSESYKQSTYCQAEAEYAFGCKRRLLPLIMKRGYKPDGWLGFMIGSRIYVDFGTFDFNTACQKLMTEISLQRKRPLPPKPGTVTQHEMPSPPEVEQPPKEEPNDRLLKYTERQPAKTFSRKFVDDWTDSDILDFLVTKNLVEMMPICEKMDGSSFLELYKMGKHSPSNTYTILNDELTATYKTRLPMSVYTRFLSVMEKRLAAPPSIPEISIKIPRAQPPKKYDLVVTSNASSQQLIQALSKYGCSLDKILSP